MNELYMIAGTEDGVRLFVGEEDINEYLLYLAKEGFVKFGKDFEEGECLVIKGKIIEPSITLVVKKYNFQ